MDFWNAVKTCFVYFKNREKQTDSERIKKIETCINEAWQTNGVLWKWAKRHKLDEKSGKLLISAFYGVKILKKRSEPINEIASRAGISENEARKAANTLFQLSIARPSWYSKERCGLQVRIILRDSVLNNFENLSIESPTKTKTVALPEFISVSEPKIKLDQVALSDDCYKAIELFALRKEIDEILRASGMDKIVQHGQNQALLLYGAPGCGKTTLAEAIADFCGRKLAVVSYASLLSKMVGETEHKLAQLFKFINQNAREYVFLIDECDSLLQKRIENVSHSPDHYINGQVNIILRALDNLDDDAMLIFCTNLIESIDPAVDRRVKKLHIPHPDVECRKKIWQVLLQNAKKADDIDINKLAQDYDVAGGYIKNIVVTAAETASLRAYHENKKVAVITREDIETSAKLVLQSSIACECNEISKRKVGFNLN